MRSDQLASFSGQGECRDSTVLSLTARSQEREQGSSQRRDVEESVQTIGGVILSQEFAKGEREKEREREKENEEEEEEKEEEKEEVKEGEKGRKKARPCCEKGMRSR